MDQCIVRKGELMNVAYAIAKIPDLDERRRMKDAVSMWLVPTAWDPEFIKACDTN